MRTCDFGGCRQKHYARGWCFTHYMQWHRNGGPTQLRPATLDERLQSSWQEDANGCWIWQGALFKTGYGQVKVQGRTQLAHRLMFKRMIRDLDRSEFLHHTCRVKRCVNPAHLEVTDRKAHALEHRATRTASGHGQETHCPQGHPYDDENTYWHHRSRHCRRCMKENKRDRHRRTGERE